MTEPIYRNYELISGKITANCSHADQANCCLLVEGLEIPFSIASTDYEALVKLGFLRQSAPKKAEAHITAGETLIID